MEGLQTPAGEKIELPDAKEVEQKFAEAMAAPVTDEVPSPPKKAPATDDKPKTATRRRTTTASRVKAAPPAPSPELDKQRSEGVSETLNLLAGGALMLRASVKDKDPQLAQALAADAVTLSSQAETFGQSCAALARHSPGFARLIDGTGKAGPWFAFGTACYSLGAQLAANHGMIPAGMLGTAKPAELAAMIEQDEHAVPEQE